MEEYLFDLNIKVPLDTFDLQLEWRTNSRVIGLFGPSGSGKTTLLETVAGLRGAGHGRIRIDGRTLQDNGRGIMTRPEERHLGYVPQEHLLFPHLSVLQNITFGEKRSRHGSVSSSGIREEVIAVLGLEKLLDRRVNSLSGGERQRVALARALCSGPRLLLLDEPLASLDAGLRRRILPYLISIRDTFGLPMLVVSHNPVELQALCEEVVAIENGRMTARGSPVEVFTRKEVYSDTMESGFENIIPCRVTGSRDHFTLLAMGKDGTGPSIRIPMTEVAEGSTIMAGIPAREIMVAREKVTGISARNCVEGTIASIQRVRETEVVSVSLPSATGNILIIELTTDAVDELQLSPGRQVYLLFKSTSVILYA